MGTDQNGLMSRDGNGRATRAVLGGDQNDVGEARCMEPIAMVMWIDWGPEPEESNLGLEIIDLALELFLRLVSLIVALLARAGVTCVVVLLARYAPHRLRFGIGL